MVQSKTQAKIRRLSFFGHIHNAHEYCRTNPVVLPQSFVSLRYGAIVFIQCIISLFMAASKCMINHVMNKVKNQVKWGVVILSCYPLP